MNAKGQLKVWRANVSDEQEKHLREVLHKPDMQSWLKDYLKEVIVHDEEGGGRVMALQLKKPNNAKFLKKNGLEAQWEKMEKKMKFFSYKTDHPNHDVLYFSDDENDSSDETNQPKRKKQRTGNTSSSREPMCNESLVDEQASADLFPSVAEPSQQPLSARNNQEPLLSVKEVAESFGHSTELENRIGLSFDEFARAVQGELQKPDLTSNQRALYTNLHACVQTMAERSRQASDEERWRTFDKSSTERCSIGQRALPYDRADLDRLPTSKRRALEEVNAVWLAHMIKPHLADNTKASSVHVHISACSLGLPNAALEGRMIQHVLGDSDCTLATDQAVDTLAADLQGKHVWIFSGHADVKLREGNRTLGFVKNGVPAAVDNDVLVSIVKEHVRKGSLRCVLLNGCESLALAYKVRLPTRILSIPVTDKRWSTSRDGLFAQLIEAGVQCVACWETPVHDEAALWFGIGFALSLRANGDNDHRSAFAQACSQVQTRLTPGELARRPGEVQKFIFEDPQEYRLNKGRTPEGRLAAGKPQLLIKPRLHFRVPPRVSHFIDKTQEVARIIDALASGSAVGVLGMGGAGKTTIASCVARCPRLCGSVCPDGVAWLDIGQSTTPEAAVVELGKMLEHIIPKAEQDSKEQRDHAMPDFEQAVTKIQSLLNDDKRVLVVADDVWNVKQLRYVKRALGEGGSNRLLITSRNERVITDLGAKTLPIRLLQTDEGLRLMADVTKVSVNDLKANEYAMKIAQNGLPIAIKTVAALAVKRDWKHVCSLLEDARRDLDVREDEYHPDEPLYRTLFAALHVSVHALGEEARERYSMLAVFMENAIPFNVLRRYWGLDDDAVEFDETIAQLVELSLIEQNDVPINEWSKQPDALDRSFGHRTRAIKLVQLHDLQREALIRKADESRVARWHAKLLGNCGVTEIGNRSTLTSEALHLYPSRALEDNASANVVRTEPWMELFAHDCAEYTERDCNGYWSGRRGQLRFLHHISQADFEDQAKGDLEHIRSLHLADLDLEHIRSLHLAQDRFEEDRASLVELPGEIWQLQSLTNLSLVRCNNLKTLPREIGQLQSLTHLDLGHCVSLMELPGEIGQLQSLTNLSLARCSRLKTLPREIGQLQSLTHLDLQECFSLVTLPDEIGQLRLLTDIILGGCSFPLDGLKSLPSLRIHESIGDFYEYLLYPEYYAEDSLYWRIPEDLLYWSILCSRGSSSTGGSSGV